MEYTGFKSQALDFNIYSDGVSVSSVIQEFALAPEDPETSGPFYEIKEGEGENAVKIWEISWSDSPPAYTDYPTRIGSSTEITNNGKNVYWERQITTYSDKTTASSTPSKSTMLDVDFINSIGITAKKITVVDDKKNLVFEADSFDPEGLVKIGGFEVDATSLSTGRDTNKVVIKSTVPSNITLEDIPDTAGGRVGVYRYDGKTYVLLDYIESTGKEYIDLGIYAKNIVSATLDFTYTGVVSNSAALDANKYNAVYGTDAGLQIARKETGEFTTGDTYENDPTKKLILSKRYTCEATYDYTDTSLGGVGKGTSKLRPHGETTYISELTRPLSSITVESTVPNVYLFSAFDNDNGGGAAYFSKAKIYNCSIGGSSGKSSYNFIPVLQVDTNTPGFYETGTNTFYTNNSGQGGFIAGPIAEVVPRISIALGAEKPNKAPFSVTNTGEVTATKGSIGGFYVDADSIASGDRENNVGIILTSTDGQDDTAKVIQAGTNFSVDADGKIVSTGGTIGGFEISPSRLFGGVTGANENNKDRVIALYAPILPLEIDFSSTTVDPSKPIDFDSVLVPSDWTKCTDTTSGKTWGTVSPTTSEIGTSEAIRRTSSWTSIKGDTLSRYFPQWKIESTAYDISGITRDEDGIEQKDDKGETLTTTGKIIDNLIIGDVVAYKFYETATSTNLAYTTSTGATGSLGVKIKKYIELQLRNSSNTGQIQYRFAIEIKPSSSWVAADYAVMELRAPDNWATDKSTVFKITGKGKYTTKTWSKTLRYSDIPGGSRTNSFTIYQITPGVTNFSSSSGKADINNDNVSTGTVELGYKGSSNGYDYCIISLTYNSGSKEFTITEEIKYIVEGGNPDPVKIKLTTDKYQDTTGTECALIAGAAATKTNNIWKVTPGTEALRIEHTGRLRLKDGLDFYQTGLSYSGAWGKESEKSWAASHNAGSTIYKWWNTDKGGYSDYWKSFAQLGVNKTYLDNGGVGNSSLSGETVDQSPATLFLAASTDATHTKFLLPRHYESSAVIRAAATPSYDSNCTAEITLSRYNRPLTEDATAAYAARTTITPDGINTGYVQFNLPGEVGDVRHYVIWSKDVTNDPRGTWNTISASELGFSPLVGWISYATSSSDITTAGAGSALDNNPGVTTSGKNIFYWVSSATNDTNKINRVTLTVIGYL